MAREVGRGECYRHWPSGDRVAYKHNAATGDGVDDAASSDPSHTIDNASRSDAGSKATTRSQLQLQLQLQLQSLPLALALQLQLQLATATGNWHWLWAVGTAKWRATCN